MKTKIKLISKRYFIDQRYWQVEALITNSDGGDVNYSNIIMGSDDKSDEDFARQIANEIGVDDWELIEA